MARIASRTLKLPVPDQQQEAEFIAALTAGHPWNGDLDARHADGSLVRG